MEALSFLLVPVKLTRRKTQRTAVPDQQQLDEIIVILSFGHAVESTNTFVNLIWS